MKIVLSVVRFIFGRSKKKQIKVTPEKKKQMALEYIAQLKSNYDVVSKCVNGTAGEKIGAKFELSGKIGVGIACGGFRNGGQELTLQCMHTFFLQQDIAVIADGPPFSHLGATVVGNTKDDELGLQTINNLIKKIIKILNHKK